MKKILVLFFVFIYSFTGFAQTKTNLKLFIENIVNHSEELKKSKIKIFLNGEEIKKLAEYEIDLNGLEVKIKKIKTDRKNEEEIEIKITATSFAVS